MIVGLFGYCVLDVLFTFELDLESSIVCFDFDSLCDFSCESAFAICLGRGLRIVFLTVSVVLALWCFVVYCVILGGWGFCYLTVWCLLLTRGVFTVHWFCEWFGFGCLLVY